MRTETPVETLLGLATGVQDLASSPAELTFQVGEEDDGVGSEQSSLQLAHIEFNHKSAVSCVDSYYPSQSEDKNQRSFA